jgi:hypothetical protein
MFRSQAIGIARHVKADRSDLTRTCGGGAICAAAAHAIQTHVDVAGFGCCISIAKAELIFFFFERKAELMYAALITCIRDICYVGVHENKSIQR